MDEIKSKSIPIVPEIVLDPAEIKLEFVRSSGPGGQNVNKVASAVQLRFDAAHSVSLPEEVRQRLINLAGKRMTSGGVLIIRANRFRSQDKNRDDAFNRLLELIRNAALKPKPRRKTRPSLVAKRKRMEEKRRRGKIKSMRRQTGFDGFFSD